LEEICDAAELGRSSVITEKPHRWAGKGRHVLLPVIKLIMQK
jgi:hypothetical protein